MATEKQTWAVAGGLSVEEGVVTLAGQPFLALDAGIQRVLETAQGLTVEEMVVDPALHAYPPILVRAAVGLLREAGVLIGPLATVQQPSENRQVDAAPVHGGRVAHPNTGVTANLPLVSVVILNRDGRRHLESCLPSLLSQTWTNVEIIVVDNGSTDDSVSLVERNYPTVRLVELGRNAGFSAGNNRGAEAARGDYVFFLNNDTEVDPRCIEEMLTLANQNPDAAAIAPKLRFYHSRAFIQGIGNSVRSTNWGSDNFIGFLDLGQFDDTQDVFSACFGAAMVDRRAWERVGPLDEAYFFYYEDSDWSYRARAMGYRIVAAPRAVVYHKFGGSMETLPTPFKLGLVVRNRLRFAIKNLEARHACRFVRNYVLEDAANLLWGALKHRAWEQAWVYLGSWFRFLLSLPGVFGARRHVQAVRRTQDADILPLAQTLFPPQVRGSTPLLSLENVERYYLPAMRSGRARCVPELKGVL